ncbi:hypothetical protein VB620_07120 [Nodularia harveyana UHCC-0300]|uniref:Uncharacterized protein n=1 Tax=Nodularia harveyana UHCC-0300 TaxID=2974287 RepID=A0ABU5UC55_9CYAN|nr:hypothetical protein [Nodularia harveyana]MEA5581108.1 hypothetical protein [Nodularia harveyana UHCC-0300]
MYSHVSGKFTSFEIIPLFLGSCLALMPQTSLAQTLPNVQPAVEFNQYTQNFQRYLVYVDSGNSQTLQQVRLIVPDAYIRQYQGRTIIQSGIFGEIINAQNLARQLQSYGINNARIVNFSDGQEVSSVNSGQSSTSNFPVQTQGSAYYAVIPADSINVPLIADKIRLSSGYSDLILERQRPRGPHVAVGPFTKYSVAVEWDKYLRKLGYRNSRVYYGK